MNKKTVISKIKLATTALFFAAVLTAGNTAKAAADNNSAKESSNTKSFNVKYIASNDEGYIFNVQYDNLSAADFDLLIKDETGEILYLRSFNGKNFSKKFQISNTLVKAVFIIRPKNADEQTVEASIKSRTTEDVVISRL